MTPLDRHAFNSAVNETLSEVQAISDERGSDYGDTWALENQVEVFADHVAKLPKHPDFDREWRRLRRCAALIDTKLSRLLGGWKHDHGIDLQAYIAAFTRWRDEYEALLSADRVQLRDQYPARMVPDRPDGNGNMEAVKAHLG